MANKCLVRLFYLFEAILWWQYLEASSGWKRRQIFLPYTHSPYKLFAFTWSEICRTLAPCGQDKASCLPVLGSLTMTREVVPPLPVVLADVSQKMWLSILVT